MGWDKGWKILYHGCALKNLIFSGGFIKKQYIGGNCLKRRAWTVCKFKGGLLKKRGVMFSKGGSWYPNTHYDYIKTKNIKKLAFSLKFVTIFPFLKGQNYWDFFYHSNMT